MALCHDIPFVTVFTLFTFRLNSIGSTYKAIIYELNYNFVQFSGRTA